ncbi:MAG: hypothetical protein E7013_04135 [Alphaproteobacteria bacterium]|nr:hypothetical protein [Alphaproteobacteria bacterium]
MSILLLRFLAIFYVVGILVLIVSLCSKAIVEKKKTLLGLFLFPILLFTKEGRSFLNKIIKEDSK